MGIELGNVSDYNSEETKPTAILKRKDDESLVFSQLVVIFASFLQFIVISMH